MHACMVTIDSVQSWFCIVVQYGKRGYACMYGHGRFCAILILYCGAVWRAGVCMLAVDCVQS